MKILITSPAFNNPNMEYLIRYAKEHADEVEINPYGRTLTVEELKQLWDGADAIVAGLEPYTPDVLNEAPDSIKQLLDYYDNDIKNQTQRYLSKSLSPYYSQEDLMQDIRVQLICSVKNLKIKLHDTKPDSDNN